MSRCRGTRTELLRLIPLAAALAWPAAGACGKKSSRAPTAALLVRTPVGSGIDLSELTWTGPVRAVRERGPNQRVLTIDASSKDAVELIHPLACPATVAAAHGEESTREVTLTPRLTAGSRPQVGFAAPFELRAEHHCKPKGGGRFVWRQTSGPTLQGLEHSADGATLRGKTHALAELHPSPLPWGIVPLSPATQGAYEFEVTWLGAGGDRATATARVTAAARANGVPSVGLGHRLLLGGPGWRITKRPPDARAELHPGPLATELTPDYVGGWELADESERPLLIRVGRYDDTPLDCGRPECHPVATRDARTTKMTNAFVADAAGRFGEGDSLRCALACHTVGEPDLDDGGFTAVQRALEVALPERGAETLWKRLPRALRRIGGVGCTGCHGPAAIPLPGVARTVLRADVCAACHDAPPRYGHVAAWRATRLAVSDADERTHHAPCVRCHTTAGFLEWQDTEFLDWQKKSPAKDTTHIYTGISCAACHDPHGGPTATRLVRRTRVGDELPDDSATARAEAVCLPCHTPLEEPVSGNPGALPAASAAWIVAGRGGLRVATGEEIEGPVQHEKVASGCLGCHRGAPEDVLVERGASHGFHAGQNGCTDGDCHAEPGSADGGEKVAAITARARLLRAELEKRLAAALPPAATGDDPPHAEPRALPADPALGRALYDVALVVEDPAAAYHNAAYARALLDEVEHWLRSTPATP